jgi:DNA-binding MarR family transcriptional regulator
MGNYHLKNTDFITITYPFLLMPDLSLEQKALLSKVASMQGDKRVIASNSYFAALLSVEARSIQRWIKDLEGRGYLIVRYSKKPDGQDERELTVNLSMIPGSERCQKEGHDKLSPPRGQDVTPPRQNVTHSIVLDKDSLEESLLSIPVLSSQEKVKRDFTRADDFFENAFWPVYPRKEKRERARELWRQLNPEPRQAIFIIRCIEYLSRSLWRNREKDKIPLPTTWLNDQGWKDEIAHGWIQEEKRRLAGEQSQRDLKETKKEEQNMKEELKRIKERIQAMGEEDKMKLREYVICTMPPSMKTISRSGKLDGIIDQLMSTYYLEWAATQKVAGYGTDD